MSAVVVQLRASAGQFFATIGQANHELGKLGRENRTALAKLGAVGKVAFASVGTSAVLGATTAVVAAGRYQESLTQLVTGAGETRRNIKLVGDGMLSMAGQVGVSAQDLSRGMYLIESAGYHGANGLDVLRAAAEGSKVGAADMASVADGLTTALNDYRLPASQAAETTSKLVRAVSLGKTHMADLAGSLATVLPAAASAGVGLDQVLGALSTMTAGGTPAADAATYLRQTIAQLSNPTAKAAHEMQGLGLSAIDISSNLGKRGLTGTMDLLTSAIEKHMGPAGVVLIEQMRKSSGSTTAFQKILANLPPTQQTFIGALATMVGGTKSMQAALELTGGNAETFAGNVREIGKATTEAGGHVAGMSLVNEDLNQKMEKLKATAETAAIEIGDRLIPIVESATSWMGKHKDALAAVASVIGVLLVTAMTVYLAHLAQTAARSVVEFARLSRAAVQWGLTQGRTFAVAAFDAARWASRTALAAARTAAVWVAANARMAAAAVAAFVAENAATLGIVASLALLVAGIVYAATHWRQVWGVIVRVVSDAAAWVRSRIGFIAEAFGPLAFAAGMFTASWLTVWRVISGAVSAAWQAIGPVVDAIAGAVSRVAGAISDLSGAVGKVSGIAGGIGHVGGSIFGKVKGWLASGGPVDAGSSYIVGERGPELFVPRSAGRIIPNGPAGTQQVRVSVFLDGAQITESVHAHLLRSKARGVTMGLA